MIIFYDYDYNNEGLDEIVHGAEINPERRELKKIIGQTQMYMTQKKIKAFADEIYSKPPKMDFITIETDVYHIDDIWSLDILDLKEYGSEKNRGLRYV